MDQQAARWTLTAALALVVGCIGLARPASAAASAVCPPPPDDLAGLISPDATYPGPLTEEFRPIYGVYYEAAANCWGGAETAVVGFVAGPEGLGGTRAYRIEPLWLVGQAHWLSVTDDVDPEAGPVGPFFGVAVPPAMESRFAGFEGQWVRVSGHFHDAAAETCVVTEGTPEPGLVPTPEQAIEICRTSFVLTSVQAASLPSTDSAAVALTPGREPSPEPAVPAIALVAAIALAAGLRRFGSAV
jgi:hypothetical protein